MGFLPVGRMEGDVCVDVVRWRDGRRAAVNGMRAAKAHGDVGFGR